MREPIRAETLWPVLHELYLELHRSEPPQPFTLASRLDADLGLDSLGRVELQLRLERRFQRHLDPASLTGVSTVQELLRVLEAATDLSDVPSALPAAAPGPNSQRTPEVAAPVSSGLPSQAATLQEVLAWRAQRDPTAVHLLLLAEHAAEPLSYGTLWKQASAVAAGLQRLGVGAGVTVALMLPTGLDFFFAFFGVLLAGAIPVPIYPPASASQLAEHVRRHTLILENAGAQLLISFPEAAGVARLLRLRVPSVRQITSVDELTQGSSTQEGPPATPAAATASDGAAMAMLQYTSGSTGTPKGVILTHTNLLANIRTMGTHVNAGPSDTLVSWLPLYHDMGLIGAWLASLYFGYRLIIMSPLSFLSRPARWLRAIHDYRGTISAAPNFAYELVSRRVAPSDLEGLDLTCWRLAISGAEPVAAETMERFRERFAPYGFQREAMTPVYGLAEAAVGITFPPLQRGVLVDRIDRARLMRSGLAVPASPQIAGVQSLVSCGPPLPGYQVRIVDEAGVELPERHEGALQFTGPSATQGYYRNPAATAQLLAGPWHNSGDRAYIADGEVYITGRSKDLIIRRGRHLYPDEIERAVGEIPGVRKGCVAVFGTQHNGTEKFVVVAETYEQASAERMRLHAAINERVVGYLGEPPDEIFLTAPRSVLKTSSGKLRRAATRAAYEQGTLRRPASASWQLGRLLLGSARPLLRRAALRGMRTAYGLYAWACFLVIAPPMLLLGLCALDSRHAWGVTRHAARLLLRVCGIPVTVRSETRSPLPPTHIVVANHCSYADALVLAALLPGTHCFVANFSWQNLPVVQAYLRRLGTLLLSRVRRADGPPALTRMTAVLAQGCSLAVFSEGTFTRAPGLRRFHLGAFEAAVRAQVPIVPLALRGTRSVLRDGRVLPSRVPVRVSIGTPMLEAAGTDPFAAALRLQQAVRAYILQHCGEPDLQ